MTPYQFVSNTPIQAIDLDGLEAVGATTMTDIGVSFDPELKLITAAYVYVGIDNPNVP